MHIFAPFPCSLIGPFGVGIWSVSKGEAVRGFLVVSMGRFKKRVIPILNFYMVNNLKMSHFYCVFNLLFNHRIKM